MTHRNFAGKSGILLVVLLVGACRGDANKNAPASSAPPTGSKPEVVNAGEPTHDPERPMAARFWVEVEPTEGRMHIFEIHPGNVIYRDQEILSPDFPELGAGRGGREGVTQVQQGLRYQYPAMPNTTQSTCTPGGSCVPAANTIRIFNPPDKTTFVNDSAACFSNGGSCDGMGGRAPAPVGLPCTSSNTICAEIHMVSRYGVPLTNVVMDIRADTSTGGTACGVSPASPVIGCQPGSTSTAMGICAHSNGNGQNKVNHADSSRTSCIPGGVMDTRPCSYCYGNTGAIDGLGASFAGLKGAVMPNLSAVSHDATLKTANTARTSLKLASSASLRLVFEVRYGVPGLPAAGQITYAFAGSGSCVNPVGHASPTWVTLNGGSFGPPFACYGDPLVSCPLTDIVRTSPPTAGSRVEITNTLGGAPTVIADGLFKLWSDRQVAFNVAMGTSGSFTATLITPLGQVSTSQTFTTCAGGPNTWRTLTSTIETVQGIGGVLGGNIVVAGGRADASDPSSVTAATRYFTIPTLATSSPLTVNNGPDMNVARWGAASAVVGGRLYAIGGAQDGFFCLDSTESWDGAAGSWTDHGIALPEGRCGASAIAIGSLIYLTGGSTSSVPGFFGAMMASTNTCVLDTTNIAAGWDCATYTGGDDISVTSRLNGGYASTGSRGLIVGGLDSGLGVLSAVETMVEAMGTPAFSAGTALAARSLPGVASANSFFYVMGGSATGGEADAGSATLHRTSNGAPGAWDPMASAPVARQGHVLVAAQCAGCTAQKLYAIGGSNSGSNVSGVDEYTE
jgi:hypothetical protein